jgi:hypothetical protein
MTLILTVDELGAAARLVGRTPPSPFAPQWTEAERGVAELVALRGLIARGLVVCPDGGEPALTAPAVLDPILDADALLEWIVDAAAGPGERTVVASAGGVSAVATQVRPGIWRVSPGAWTPPDLPASTVDIAGPTVRVDRATVGRVEQLLARDASGYVAGLLERSGLDSQVSALVAAVLTGARTMTTVRVVRSQGPNVLTVAAYTWLDAADRGLWSVTATEDDGYELAPAPAPAVRAAVADVVAHLRPVVVA